MRAIAKPLLGLALFFGRLQAQTPYEALCNSPPVQPEELGPGVAATYRCDHAFYTDDWTGDATFAGTPKACALQCARWSSEGRCGWQKNACYRYKAGRDSDARLGSITIEIRKSNDAVNPSSGPGKTSEKQCFSDLDACNAAKSTNNQELEQCRADRKQCTALIEAQDASCEAKQVALNGKITKCNADAVAKIKDLQDRLDRHVNCDITHGKSTTNLHVNKGCIFIDGNNVCAPKFRSINGGSARIEAKLDQAKHCFVTFNWPSNYGDIYYGADNCLYDSKSQKINGQCCR